MPINPEAVGMLAAASVLCLLIGWDLRRTDRFARLPRISVSDSVAGIEKIVGQGILALIPATLVIYPEGVRVKTQQKLKQAAIEWTAVEWLALKLFAGLGATLIGLFLAGIAGGEFLIAVVLACLGYFAPDLYLDHRVKKRQAELSRSMPDFGLFFSTALKAGSGDIYTALHLSAQKFGGEIGKEVAIAAQSILSGKRRADALRELAERCGVEEMTRLVDTILQAAQYDTPLSDAVKEYSSQARLLRRLDAEKRAAELAVRMVFPMIIFIVMPLLVMLVYPALVQLTRTLASH